MKPGHSMILLIGDKNLSSWSLRPWLALKSSGLPFIEKKILLDVPGYKERILHYSPTGRVPALIHNGHTIWDSLAICEYINELSPQSDLYPKDQILRAQARSMIAEMHSGFQGLRNQLSMNIQLKIKMDHLDQETVVNIKRIVELWKQALSRSQGPYLFGKFGIVDAFYAPVALRFHSYGVNIQNASCKKYVQTILRNPYVQEWIREAKKEQHYEFKFK